MIAITTKSSINVNPAGSGADERRGDGRDWRRPLMKSSRRLNSDDGSRARGNQQRCGT